MSKIFDALQGTQSEVSQLLPSLIGDPAPAGRAPVTHTPEETAPEEIVKESAPEVPSATMAIPEPVGIPAKGIRRLPLVVSTSEALLPFENPQEHAAEQYRIARTKLAHHPNHPKMIVISSASPGDGKTFTAINLAGALSLKGETKVLLLDGDFRRTSMHSRLGLPPSPGLAEVIMGDCSFENAVVQADQFPNLYIMVRGDTKSVNPTELLDSPAWRSFCRRIRAEFEYVIIDSPPVAAVADFDLIQIAADGTILVVRPEHTKRSACLKAIETIPANKLLGVMLNCSPDWFLSKHDSYGYGYSDYASSAPKGKPASL